MLVIIIAVPSEDKLARPTSSPPTVIVTFPGVTMLPLVASVTFTFIVTFPAVLFIISALVLLGRFVTLIVNLS